MFEKTENIFLCFEKAFMGMSLENPYEISLVHLENRRV